MTDIAEEVEADDSEIGKEVIVRRYWLKPPLDWGPDCEDELYKQKRLWNKLVEIDHADREAFTALTKDVPEVETARNYVDEIDTELKAAEEAKNKIRQQARQIVPTPELDLRIETLSNDLGRALNTLREARRAALKEVPKERRKEIDDARRLAVKHARQNSGLWWGNYNAVVQSYEKARSLALRHGGHLHFYRHDGSGRFTNQIQKGMTIAKLFGGGKHSQVSIHDVQEEQGHGHNLTWAKLTATIFTRNHLPRTVTWPIVIHRPILDDALKEEALIKEVTITRRKVAESGRGSFQWGVTFTCTRSVKKPIPLVNAEPIVAINLGWRRVPDGLRVATILNSQTGVISHLILPKKWMASFDHLDDLRSRRDNHFNEAMAIIKDVDWTTAPPALSTLAIRIKRVAHHMPYNLVTTLVSVWREHEHDWQPDISQMLESWRRLDKRIWHEYVNLFDKLSARREAYYRTEAKKIIDAAGSLIITKMDLSKLAKAKEQVKTPASRNRMIAGAWMLRGWLQKQANKQNKAVTDQGGLTTWICHVCLAKVHSGQRTIMRQTCGNCLSSWDQDENNCWVMLWLALGKIERP